MLENPGKKSTWKKALLILFGVLGIFLLIIFVTAFFIDESLRGYMESKANANLKGYKVELGSVDFHPLGFSIDMENLILKQEAHPDPPLLTIPFWSASIQWTELVKMKIVSDHVIKNAKIDLHFSQAEKEAKDKEALKERGWQEAVYALYPVTINTIQIENSAFFYKDPDYPPLEVTNIQLRVKNIQNIRAPEGDYPSSLQMEGNIPGSGSLQFTGNANFLSEPFPGVSGNFELHQVELKPFVPVTSLLNVHIQSGTLNGQGHVEFSPLKAVAHVTNIELVNPSANYVMKDQSEKTTNHEAQPSKPKDEEKSVQKAKSFQIVVDHASIKNGEVGYVNNISHPSYRIFFNHLNMNVTGMGAPTITRESAFHLSGKFMGKGETSLDGEFKPEIKKPDFDVKLKIEKTDLTTLNNLFKAYGEFDVQKGTFSFFAELKVHNGQVKGYIKPFFKNPEVFNLAQDKTDNIFQQMYEGIVGAVTSILENSPQDQVATKTEISGNVKNINMNTWELIGNLVRNAFFDALTPAFENLKSMGKDE